ncbi:MAG: Amidase [Caulobacter sp.]|nr:Amidase [Caulobacter sp.]
MRLWLIATFASTALAGGLVGVAGAQDRIVSAHGEATIPVIGPFSKLRRPDCGAVPEGLPSDRWADSSISEIQDELASGRLSAVCLAVESADRIDVLENGSAHPFPERLMEPYPGLHAVIAANPHIFADARNSDARRKAGKSLGPLEGIPILLKDNIESWDDTATTAGSLALAQNRPQRDAPLVRRLTDAGALILGKTNLSEWANFRSSRSLSGWSGVGGQARNPYALDRSPCGSSAGSAVAVAAGYAPAAIGTETDGSITCPAAVNGIVGLKPTVGLISRSGIVPISHTQDTPGPMTRTVRDAAILLTVMAGSDPADPATAEADAHKSDYAAALDADSLKGRRIGVLRFAAGFHPETDAAFEAALDVLRGKGAILVDIPDLPHRREIGAREQIVLQTEFKVDLNAYLATTDPAKVKTRTLADVIAFNRAHPIEELPFFGQETFEKAEATKGLDDPAYIAAKADAHRMAGPEGIDALLAQYDVVALAAPTLGPAWPIDPVLRDRYVGGGAGTLAAVAGYPHLTVPMGLVGGLPVGLSFIGPAWSEARLLSLGYAYEQASKARKPPAFAATVSAP